MTREIHTHLQDGHDYGETARPTPVAAKVTVTETGIDISFPDAEGVSRASVYVEFWEGEIVARIWDERDEYGDPTARARLFKPAEEARAA